MSAHILPKRSNPKLASGMLASAALHALILVCAAIFVSRVSRPVEVPLHVTWIRVAPPPLPKIEEPGGSSGGPPKPAAPPKPVPPKPKPVQVVRKPLPKPKPVTPPPKYNPLAKERAPAPPPQPAPPSDSLSARIAENEYIDMAGLGGSGGGAGSGTGHGRGTGLGDGVGAGVAPRRPIVYLARSMYQPDRKDLEVYDKMFWHVVDHWEIPPEYRGKALVTTINARFDQQGNITKFKFIRKSGDPAFDDTVVRALVSANPLPAPTREFYQRFYDNGVDFVIEPKDIYFYSWPDPYAKKKGRFGF
jgi:hypothetical protein